MKTQVQTNSSTIVYCDNTKIFSGIYGNKEIENNDLFKKMASKNKIPQKEKLRIGLEFCKIGRIDIVLLMSI